MPGMLFNVPEQKPLGKLQHVVLGFVDRFLYLFQPKPVLVPVNAASQKISAANQKFVS